MAGMSKYKPKRAKSVRNRIVEERAVRKDGLQDHPRNWRTHDDTQKRTMDDLFSRLGNVKRLDVYIPKPTDSFVTEGLVVDGVRVYLRAGVPCIMDGHLRRDRLPEDFDIPINVTDLGQEEALLYLATCDPLAALAGQDDERLTATLAEIDSDSAAVQAMLSDLLDLGGEDDGDEGEDQGGKTFQILVTCAGEEQQRELIEEFLTRGIDHKALLG